MTTEDEMRGGVETHLLDLWCAIGHMALTGQFSLASIQWGCEVLVVVASVRRNQGVKARAARELKKSRKQVRKILYRWNESFDCRTLLAELRSRSDADQTDEPPSIGHSGPCVEG